MRVFAIFVNIDRESRCKCQCTHLIGHLEAGFPAISFATDEIHVIKSLEQNFQESDIPFEDLYRGTARSGLDSKPECRGMCCMPWIYPWRANYSEIFKRTNCAAVCGGNAASMKFARSMGHR